MSASIPVNHPNPAEVIGAQQVRTSGLSIAGFILAFVFAIAGLIVSLIARSEIDKSDGQLGGRSLASAGIYISVINMVLSLLWVFSQ